MLISIILISSLLITARAQPPPFTANASSVWTISRIPDTQTYYYYTDSTTRSEIRTILLRSTSSVPSSENITTKVAFSCGFYCSGPPCDKFILFVSIIDSDSDSAKLMLRNPPTIIWSANPNRLVGENATLRFSPDGNLVLRDGDGTQVWSTNTTGEGIVGVNITDTGNLVLFDKNNVVQWDSFDYQTDTWVLGQTLTEGGHQLTANALVGNSTQMIKFGISSYGLRAFVDTNPPQVYYNTQDIIDSASLRGSRKKGSTYVTFTNGSLSFYATINNTVTKLNGSVSLPTEIGPQYIRLESDGHLWLHQYSNGSWFRGDGLIMGLDNCAYPTVCGKYSICTNDQQCSCPSTSSFKQVNLRLADRGCELETPLTCDATHQDLVPVTNVSYFTYDLNWEVPTNMSNSTYDTNAVRTDEDSCKKRCLSSCSCKAAFFRYGAESSLGSCYLLSELFSMMTNDRDEGQHQSTAFIKVQNVVNDKKAENTIIIATTSVGFILLVICSILTILRKRKKKEKVKEEESLELISGIPARFSFEELKIATENFCKKLGQGGFGSVFEGTLNDGTRIAVKQLESVGQGKKEFLAEVETIGSIHHINLVRLIGFCAENSHRLLIYEHMSNGSLDQWIFKRSDIVLDWDTRRRIITDIAKGLAYLHEECRQRIAHLDIKPQNILLDQELRAKVSDFGLSKLIDRDQSSVMTRMRGTPGYLAPEWLTSMITEKADVYSFGVVVTEILCGRKNIDYSKSEDSFHLLSLMQEKFEENKVMDLVDDRIKDLNKYETEIFEMMKLAIWCLQYDCNRRPSMSTAVKMLEGLTSVESDIEYKFLTRIPRTRNDLSGSIPSPWLLSGAR